jgi:hypothetical protein
MAADAFPIDVDADAEEAAVLLAVQAKLEAMGYGSSTPAPHVSTNKGMCDVQDPKQQQRGHDQELGQKNKKKKKKKKKNGGGGIKCNDSNVGLGNNSSLPNSSSSSNKSSGASLNAAAAEWTPF